MLVFLLGMLSLIGVVFTSLLFFWNQLKPLQSEKRIKLHCNVGLVSLLPTIVHSYLSHQSISSSGNESMIQFGLLLYLIVIASGMILSYFPRSGKIRYYARSFHPALVFGLAIILLSHIWRFFR
jgi:hypothetical protein